MKADSFTYWGKGTPKIGSLRDSHSFRYCLTSIDRFTQWPEIIPLKSITAQSCAEALCREWIPHFDVPAIIITDQRMQFGSGKLLGFKCHRTTAYHSQSNGMLERWRRTLKAAISKFNRQPVRTRFSHLSIHNLISFPYPFTKSFCQCMHFFNVA